MLFYAQLRRVWWISIWCLALASSSFGANKSLMSIDGARQGPFAGQGTDKPGNTWSEIIAFDYRPRAERDASTGRASGRAQPTPIQVTLETGPVSRKIQQAAATNEELRSVVFEFYRTGTTDQREYTKTIRLAHAHIVNIRKIGIRLRKDPQSEEIIIDYEKFETIRPPQK